MSLTVTKEYFYKNFDKEDNRYVGDDINSEKARSFDFKNHQQIVKDIKEICLDSPLKIERMRNIVSVCLNILIENKRDINKISTLKELFQQFSFFMATTSEDEVYYECPCTQPYLYELDWFNVKGTDNVFYVGSECVNKFGDEEFQSDHKKKLKEQLTLVKIDKILEGLKTSKEDLLFFCRINYIEIYDSLRSSDSLTNPQMDKLQRVVSKEWKTFFSIVNGSNYDVGDYVKEHRPAFRHYLELIEDRYQPLFVALLRKRNLTGKQYNALGVSGKIILRKLRSV
ncbi:MAG: hypothetical protein QS98_C0005G0021 [archaeon GW2011_AR3]|nr:MAG: hypothetical protein QS98_C0005G0021 [archaeon GW2011_AR3]MBS3109471.1 hypothetical protein [Candidatus Woesearchaeota archaeon]